jgi:peptidoglycan hydrolase CwlO-like protein
VRLRTKLAVSAAAAWLVTGSVGGTVLASKLTEKQREMHQLQAEANQNAQKLSEQRKRIGRLRANVAQTRASISQVSQQIQQNQAEIAALQKKIRELNDKIDRNQRVLEQDKQNVAAMLRATYEYGTVPLFEVIFKATSWSDFLSRVASISAVTQREHDLVKQVAALQRQLEHDQHQQQANAQSLVAKGRHLLQLKQTKLSLEQRQQHSLVLANRGLASLQSRQSQLQMKIHLTREQLKQLEEQTREQERIIATQSGDVVIPELRYHDLSVDKLYAYVQRQGSTFSRADIETICEAGRRYDVNPALLLAITGQEQAFVPPGPDADLIRNNPFNVFYSWQVYNTSLADTANIAADTIRHKLSVPPPHGEDAILWINDPHNPWGIYATDPNWAYGVRRFFHSIMAWVG